MTSTNNIPKESLLNYVLMLADDRLILGHRISEWSGHGPILEEDLALSNIGLDLLGQAQLFYNYAAELLGDEKTEDYFVYFRNDTEYKNAQLLEIPNGDYANTLMRLLFFDVYSINLLEKLSESEDETISAIAQKSIKEVKYHLRHSTDWILRLGDGTKESHKRCLNALDTLWLFTGDLFEPTIGYEHLLEKGIAPDIKSIKETWEKKVFEILEKATLPRPDKDAFMLKGGRKGIHTEHLGYILTEMQFLARSIPEAKWH